MRNQRRNRKEGGSYGSCADEAFDRKVNRSRRSIAIYRQRTYQMQRTQLANTALATSVRVLGRNS